MQTQSRITPKHILPFSLLLFGLLWYSCQEKSESAEKTSPTLTQAGAGTLLFDGYEPLLDRPVQLWYYLPSDHPVDRPLLMVCHGMRRNADDYRDNWIELAKQYNIIIVAPEFSEEHYPKSAAYNLGNLFDSIGAPIPEAQWSFSLIDPIFDFVVKQLGGQQKTYDLFGHSAGGQFAHRFITFKKNPKVDRIITANAGWYTMPDFSIEYPYGLKGTPVDTSDIRLLLQHKVIVLLGDADTLRTSSLRQTPEADRQGRHRYARGLSYFAEAKQRAIEQKVPLNWIMKTVPGVGHKNAQMAPAAAELLYGEK
jgi:pimeloyl-ACP methyl ester carboxylesterase